MTIPQYKKVWVWHVCDGWDEAARFHNHNNRAISVCEDGCKALRVNERGGKVASAHTDDIDCAHKCDSVSFRVASIVKLCVYVEMKMVTEPNVLKDAMLRLSWPPSFGDMSPSVKKNQLWVATLSSTKM